MGSASAGLGGEEVCKPARSLLWGALESPNGLLRCVAAEGSARLVQAVNDPNFTVSMTMASVDKYVPPVLLNHSFAILVGDQ